MSEAKQAKQLLKRVEVQKEFMDKVAEIVEEFVLKQKLTIPETSGLLHALATIITFTTVAAGLKNLPLEELKKKGVTYIG